MFLILGKKFLEMLKFARGIIRRGEIRWNTGRFDITTSSSILIHFSVWKENMK